MKPKARHDQVLFEEVDDELVVFDHESDRAYSLNRTAAVVWQHCDGEHDLAALAVALRQTVSDGADEDLVMLAIDQLAAGDLIEGVPARTPAEIRFSRRQFVRKAGVVGAAGLTLPLVVGIDVPAAVAATTCDECICPCKTC